MLQFWFELASPYSYIAAMRVETECARAGVPVEYRPFLLGPIFTALLGIKDSPFNLQPVRGRYMWRDVERLCAKHALPWRRPSVFPRNSVLPARIALSSGAAIAAVTRAIFLANFADDQDISDPAVLVPLIDAAGSDGRRTVELAQTQEMKDRLRASTDEARRLGIFGAPDFVVNGELFFGQDRLEDAIEWARRS
jgi:2-hydroxychromene-2-carboxylate isomerase